MRTPTWKIVLILGLTLWGGLLALPNALSKSALEKWPTWLPHQAVSLGLDLQGGAQLLLQVEVEKALGDYYEGLTDSIRRELRKDRIGYRNLRAGDDRITIELRDEKDHAAAEKILRRVDQNLDVTQKGGRFTLTLSEVGLKARRDFAMDQSIEIVRRRIDETGTKEPVIARQGDQRIIVQLPGVDNPERIKDILGKTAKLSFHLVDVTADTLVAKPGYLRLPMQEDPSQFLMMEAKPIITGDMLRDANTTFDQGGLPAVSFAFDSVGARRFADVTTKHVGTPFAIVLDGTIISAPSIREPITGGAGQITGNFSAQEASDLAILLRAGALPAPLTVVEERTVGPTLGADSIVSGRNASLIGMALVCGLVIMSYGLWGILASVALAANMIFIFAILSLFQATLTLPGIAGIVLTIGMAVDANVLIYERVREEWMLGRTPLAAIDAGYNRAMSAVMDTNLTALISALALMSFGVGPIRGFAVTLIIGVVTSLFSAIWLTRLMIMAWFHFTRAKSLPFPREEKQHA